MNPARTHKAADLISAASRNRRHIFPKKKSNGPMTLQTLAVRMAVWGRGANLRLHPQRCRHTHVNHAIRLGVDLFTLSATLGHSST